MLSSNAMSAVPALPGSPSDMSATTLSKESVEGGEDEVARRERISRVQKALKERLNELDAEIRMARRRNPADPQLIMLFESKSEVFNSLIELSARENVPLFAIVDKPTPVLKVAATQSVASRPSSNGGRMPDADGFCTPPKHLIAKKGTIRNVPNNDIPSKKSKIDNIKSNLLNEAENVENVEIDDNDVNMDAASTAHVTKREKRPPPFFINVTPEWDTILASIRVLSPDVSPKIIKNHIRFHVNTAVEHMNVVKYLKSVNIPFRTFRLETETPLKVVCRGLPIYTKIENIKAEIEDLGFKVMNITQLKRGPKTKSIAMPLYYIQLAKLPDFNLIYSVTELLGLEVQIEKYRGKKGPSQCHNCQGFFHSAAACHMPTRCVKCGQAHWTHECTKAFEDPCLCCNCGGDHPANFRGCSSYPKERDTKPKKNQRTFIRKNTEPSCSYAHAVSGSRQEQAKSAAPKISSVPSGASINDTDFISKLLQFETRYSRQTVLAAFSNSLADLRSAPTEIDRVFILYQSLVTLAG